MAQFNIRSVQDSKDLDRAKFGDQRKFHFFGGYPQPFDSPFSAVSTPPIARAGSFFKAFFEIYKIFTQKKKDFGVDSTGAQECKSCSSRKMLKFAPALAIGGVDTAEKGRLKVRS